MIKLRDLNSISYDTTFIVVPNFYYVAILWDSIEHEFVGVQLNWNDDLTDRMLTIDEAIDQDFISRNDYIQILADANSNYINKVFTDSDIKEALKPLINVRINEMKSFYGRICKFNILGV